MDGSSARKLGWVSTPGEYIQLVSSQTTRNPVRVFVSRITSWTNSTLMNCIACS
jgi:hypothetical protein